MSKRDYHVRSLNATYRHGVILEWILAWFFFANANEIHVTVIIARLESFSFSDILINTFTTLLKYSFARKIEINIPQNYILSRFILFVFNYIFCIHFEKYPGKITDFFFLLSLKLHFRIDCGFSLFPHFQLLIVKILHKQKKTLTSLLLFKINNAPGCFTLRMIQIFLHLPIYLRVQLPMSKLCFTRVVYRFTPC